MSGGGGWWLIREEGRLGQEGVVVYSLKST